MVVSAYTLMEQGNWVERQNFVKSLWNVTENYLVSKIHV